MQERDSSPSQAPSPAELPRGASHTVAIGGATAETAVTVDLKDRMLGEFRLLRRLGRGGMADVYLAEQTSLGRQVAVKVLRAERLAGADDLVLRRFIHEAKAAAALSHPNIVQVYVIGEQDGIHYIAQEYVHGLNLREYLQKKGPPPLPLALHIMKQVASALQKAGEAGIVHRDIKPENIMITRQGVAKVADFGLAQLSMGGERINLTQIGVTMGTPLYMSPEQVHGEKLDQRSDIYSFGVSCYHILAATPPYRGETALSIAMQHVSGKAEPLGTVRPDLPPALCQIVHRMMASKIEDRYPDAQSLLNDLKRVEQELKERPETAAQFAFNDGLDPLDFSRPSSWLDRAVHWSRRRRWVAYSTACLLALLISAVIGSLLRPPDPLKIEAPAGPVPQTPTAVAQFQLALIHFPHNEEYWRAVINHKTGEIRYRRKAQEQLGLLYLRKLRLDEAEQIFQELASLDGQETVQFQITGTAGLAVVASLRGDYARSQQIMDSNPRRRPLSGEIRRYWEVARERNGEELGETPASEALTGPFQRR